MRDLSAERARRSICILGIGNEARGDDALGLEALGRLRQLTDPDIRLSISNGDPERMMELWSGSDAVILIDAVRSNGSPGAMYRLDVSHEPLPAQFFTASTHGFGVAEAIELARALEKLPPRAVVFGVEAETVGIGTTFSDAVRFSMERLVEAILTEVRNIQAELHPSPSPSINMFSAPQK
jgi:hydrogenase maturation protease